MCKSVLYIEDSRLQQELFNAMFRRKYDIISVGTAEEAKELLKTINFDAIVVDLHLGCGMDGASFIRWASKEYIGISFTLLTADIFFEDPDINIIHKPYEREKMEF